MAKAPAEHAPKRMSREDRRAMLLEAAGRTLAAGADTLSFETIAAEAGVSATLPYKYFDSVDEVALELYRRTVQAVDDATDRILTDPDRTFDDKVRDALRLWCDELADEGSLFLRLSAGAELPGLGREVHRRRARVLHVWAEQIEQEFGVSAVAARLAAASLTTGSSAVLQRWFVERLDRDETIDRFVAMARAQCEALRESG